LIDINDENLYDNAEVDIIKNNDDVFNVDGVEYETGTYIKV
jgi:hypothetical protein